MKPQNIALNLCFSRPRLKSVAVKSTKKCGGRLAGVCPGSHQQASIHRWPSREQLPATIKIGKGNTRSTHFPLRWRRGTKGSTCTPLRGIVFRNLLLIAASSWRVPRKDPLAGEWMKKHVRREGRFGESTFPKKQTSPPLNVLVFEVIELGISAGHRVHKTDARPVLNIHNTKRTVSHFGHDDLCFFHCLRCSDTVNDEVRPMKKPNIV